MGPTITDINQGTGELVGGQEKEGQSGSPGPGVSLGVEWGSHYNQDLHFLTNAEKRQPGCGYF